VENLQEREVTPRFRSKRTRRERKSGSIIRSPGLLHHSKRLEPEKNGAKMKRVQLSPDSRKALGFGVFRFEAATLSTGSKEVVCLTNGKALACSIREEWCAVRGGHRPGTALKD